MAATAASAVLAAARVLYDTVQQVKANKRQARLLAERVAAVVDPVRAFSDARLAQPEVQAALAQLLAAVHDAAVFVADFGDMGRVKRAVFKTGHAERFAELSARLSHAAQALTLGAVLQLHFQSADDVRAQAQDGVRDKDALGVWNVVPECAHFVGRDAELAGLAQLLQPAASARGAATRIAISGMGGTGKSTLAQWAAASCAERFTSGWALDGSNAAALQIGLQAVAADIQLEVKNLEHLPRAVRARLGRPDLAGWLLIVDNVDDAEFSLVLPSLLPATGGCILVTSRLAHWDREGWAMMSLAPMPGSEAREILLGAELSAVSGAGVVSGVVSGAGAGVGAGAGALGAGGSAAVGAVADLLGGLPLALCQARSLVRRTRISWPAYLDRLRQQLPAVLGTALPSLQLSLQAALQEMPACAPVLQMLQVLHPDDVPRTILAKAYGRLQASASASAARGPDADSVLVLLADFSIIQLSDAFVKTHRLMQEAMRQLVPVDASVLTALAETMNAETMLRVGLDESVLDPNPLLAGMLALHYPVVVDTLERRLPDSLLLSLTLYSHHQVNLLVHGLLDIALAQKCASLLERTIPDEQGAMKGPMLGVLSIALAISGATSTGLQLAERVMALGQRSTEGPFRLFAYTVMTCALYHVGRFAEARDHLSESMKLSDGPTNAARQFGGAVAMIFIFTYMALGDYAQALEVTRFSASLLENRHNRHDLYLLVCTRYAGEALCELGHIREGLPIIETVAKTFDDVFGSEMTVTPYSRNGAARAYGRCGAYDKQLQTLSELLAYYLARPVFGLKHLATAQCQVQMADAYGALGDPKRQRELADAGLATLETVLGRTDHIDVARAQMSLGDALGALGEPGRQVGLQEMAVAQFEAFFGGDHVETARMRTRLARGLLRVGQVDRARAQLERALAAQERAFEGGEHGDVAHTLVVMAHVPGPQDGGRAILERALGLFERHYGPAHPSVASVLQELVVLAPAEVSFSAKLRAITPSASKRDVAGLGVNTGVNADVSASKAGMDVNASEAGMGMMDGGKDVHEGGKDLNEAGKDPNEGGMVGNGRPAPALASVPALASLPALASVPALESVPASTPVPAPPPASAPPVAASTQTVPASDGGAAGAGPASGWTVDDVGRWLRRLDLDEPDAAVAAFAKAGVRGRHLRLFTETTLQSLGVGLMDALIIQSDLATLS